MTGGGMPAAGHRAGGSVRSSSGTEHQHQHQFLAVSSSASGITVADFVFHHFHVAAGGKLLVPALNDALCLGARGGVAMGVA
jgi:hypothetical protein